MTPCMLTTSIGEGVTGEHCKKIHDDVCSVNSNTLEPDSPCQVGSNTLEAEEVDLVTGYKVLTTGVRGCTAPN